MIQHKNPTKQHKIHTKDKNKFFSTLLFDGWNSCKTCQTLKEKYFSKQKIFSLFLYTIIFVLKFSENRKFTSVAVLYEAKFAFVISTCWTNNGANSPDFLLIMINISCSEKQKKFFDKIKFSWWWKRKILFDTKLITHQLNFASLFSFINKFSHFSKNLKIWKSRVNDVKFMWRQFLRVFTIKKSLLYFITCDV